MGHTANDARARWRTPQTAIALGLLGTLLVVAPAARADDREPPRPSAMEDWRVNVGKWACDCRALGEGAHAFKATGELSRELDGHAYVWRWEEAESGEHRSPNRVIELWGYDAATRRTVKTFVSRDGRGVQTSTGWSSDRWIWEGEGYRIPVLQRVRGRDLSFTVDVRKDEQWVPVIEGTCKPQ